MSEADEGPSLTTTEIARLLDYNVSTVSNWRKRFQDFPQPDATGRFAAAAVSRWLQQHGRGSLPASPGPVRETAAAEPLTQAVDEGDLGTPLLLTLITMLGLVPQSQQATTAEDLRRYAEAAEETGTVPEGALTGILAMIPAGLDLAPAWHRARAEIEKAGGPAQISRRRRAARAFRSRAQRGRVLGRKIGETNPSPELNRLIAALMPSSAATLLDPAAGLGFLILDTAARSRRQVRATAIEINGIAASLCGQNLALAGVHAEVHTADAFDLVPGLDGFDAVTVHPPLGMRVTVNSTAESMLTSAFEARSSDQGYAWLALATTHLNPGGRAAVVTNRASLMQSRDARARRQLLRQGSVQSIIGLPRRFLVGTPAPAALWIVGPPSDIGREILFIDGAQVDPHDFVDSAVDAFERWSARPSRFPSEEGFCGTVDALRVLADDNAGLDPTARIEMSRPLSPQRGRGRARKRTAQLQQHLLALTDHLDAAPRRFHASGTARNVPLSRAEELGLVRILRPRIDGETTQAASVGALAHSRRMLRSRGSGHRCITTEPGDVVVQLGQDVRAAVDDEGGTPVSHPLLVLRPEDPRVDPFLLALLVESTARLGSSIVAPPRTGGSQRLATLPPTVTIPLLEGDDADATRGAARRVYRLTQAAQALDYNARRLNEEFLDALRAGLRPTT